MKINLDLNKADSFVKEIEIIVDKYNMDYMEAILYYCDIHSIDEDYVAHFVVVLQREIGQRSTFDEFDFTRRCSIITVINRYTPHTKGKYGFHIPQKILTVGLRRTQSKSKRDCLWWSEKPRRKLLETRC